MIPSRGKINNIMKVWNLVRGMTASELRRLQTMETRIAVAGNGPNREWLLGKLGGHANALLEYDNVGAARVAGEALILDADDLSLRTDAGFAAATTELAKALPANRISLAAHYAAMRPAIVELMTREAAAKNAQLAAISALPGIVPIFDWMLPATAAGDMIALTRNQINLLLEIATCYGLEPDPRARITELIPVVGGAFGWRALAREVLGLVPGGVGLAVKTGVAYAGTYAVGRAASYFYATGGKKLDIKSVYRTVFLQSVAKGRAKLESKLHPTVSH